MPKSLLLAFVAVPMIAGPLPAQTPDLAAGANSQAITVADEIDSRPPRKVGCGAPPEDQEQREARGSFAVSGLVSDEMNQPLPGIDVALYRVSRGKPQGRFAETRTDAAGLYQFARVPPLADEDAENDGYYAVVATAPGRASQIEPIGAAERVEVALRMPRAARLSGRVMDPEGKPVAGALVWGDAFWGGPVAGVRSATTDGDGEFAIDDLAPLEDEAKRVQGLRKRVAAPTTGHHLLAQHPDFADQRLVYARVPGRVDIKLAYGGDVRGRVVDAVTGKPGAAVIVRIQPTKQSSVGKSDPRGWREALTNAEGEYVISNLAPLEYIVWASAKDRTCAALNSIPVAAKETSRAANLELVEGSWLEGRVQTLRGQPVNRDPQTGQRLRVGLSGPSRPRSGTSFESCAVDDDGRFRLRVPAGRHFPWILSPGLWQRTWRMEKFERGVDVEAGRSAAVNFRLLDKEPKPLPPPRPERDPVKLPAPVAAERDAAETIRDLGGWYQLDGEGRVVEINMVYHEAGGVRYDNGYTDSDEALRIAPAFPRLKRLFLHRNQATDDSLACLADLKGLQTFFIWDATAVTDAGAKHLAQLENLENIHLSGSALGDAALEALSRLPNLSRMSLQQNAFTDAGLAHLAEMSQLRSLWIGMSKGKITDAGLAHLAGLEELEQLDLQQSQITDAGLEHLKGLKNLRSLYLSTAPVTDKGLASLREALPNLNVSK